MVIDALRGINMQPEGTHCGLVQLSHHACRGGVALASVLTIPGFNYDEV